MHNKGKENIICKIKRFSFEALLSTANIRCLVQLTWSVIPDMVLLRQKSTYPFFSLAYDGVIIDVPLAMTKTLQHLIILTFIFQWEYLNNFFSSINFVLPTHRPQFSTQHDGTGLKICRKQNSTPTESPFLTFWPCFLAILP